MKPSPLYARVLLLLSSALLFTSAVAAEEPIDEIIVRGTPNELELDDSAWRIDLKRHVNRIARSVRTTLGSSESRVAVAAEPDRG